jgi:hypothetical protein
LKVPTALFRKLYEGYEVKKHVLDIHIALLRTPLAETCFRLPHAVDCLLHGNLERRELR